MWTEVQEKAGDAAFDAWISSEEAAYKAMLPAAEAVRKFYAERLVPDDEKHVEALARAMAAMASVTPWDMQPEYFKMRELRIARTAIAWMREHTLAPIAESVEIDEEKLLEEIARASYEKWNLSCEWGTSSEIGRKGHYEVARAIRDLLRQRGYLRTPPQPEREMTREEALLAVQIAETKSTLEGRRHLAEKAEEELAGLRKQLAELRGAK